jgi:DNA polymerase-1
LTDLVPIERWARVDPFLLSSPNQVKAYLSHKGYKIPKNRKTKRPTADEEALAEILRKHTDPTLEMILEGRHLAKAISYLEDTFLGKDGRLHPRYTVIPKTGRLSAKAPNIMTLPQGREGGLMTEVASAIRSTIIPEPGYVLAELDWKAIEAVLVGYFASDKDYILAAKKGVHAIFASHLLASDGLIKEPVSPREDIEEFVAWIKKAHPGVYAKAKKRIHAGSYGQGAYNMAKDLGCSVDEVRKLDAVFASMAPKVAKWQTDTRRRAHSEGKLVNPFSYALNFFEVFTKRDGEWVLGKEASEVLAFLPQSTGAAMLRECIVILGNHPDEGEKFHLLIPTHDSLALEIRIECLDEILRMVRGKMECCWPELGGLSIEVDIKVGKCLSEKEMRPYALS